MVGYVVALLFMIVVVAAVTVASAVVVLGDTRGRLVVGLFVLVSVTVLADLSAVGVVVWAGVLVGGVVRLARLARPCDGPACASGDPVRPGSVARDQ